MPKYLDKPPCDLYKMSSCEHTKKIILKVLENMLDMMAQMIKMMQEISKVLPPRKEDMSDTHNLDHENLGIIDDHGKIQPELVTEDHWDELNIVEMVSNLIDVATDLPMKEEVRDELTTNMELKLIVNESVKELIHFLAIVENVTTEKVDEFDEFSSNKGKNLE
ncbi:hypothetical protein J1N35_043723 [Gossypium stocksii]|uniref:Uncharacterized protein n=1 Tax=Gossypium stocksii TaxID=47602 RepID=A0A9D3ZFA7_9ROSI|nr:hypothetical protein J1N35_043723 [Gossypium stocksii]